MQTEYRVPLHNRLARALLRPIFRWIFYILCRVRIAGMENIPKSGAYLIAINHISLYEPPFVLAFWPVAPEAAGAVDIWERRGQSSLVRLYGGIPVHRGQYDRLLIDTILAALRTGRPLLIAPEGGRTHTLELQRAMPGLAYIIEQAQLPVVPVGVVGTSDDFLSRALHGKRPVIEMHIGQPFHLPPLEGKGEQRRRSRQRNVDLVMQRIAALLPAQYRGAYAQEPRNPSETAS